MDIYSVKEKLCNTGMLSLELEYTKAHFPL
jgi:hypothetical protein